MVFHKTKILYKNKTLPTFLLHVPASTLMMHQTNVVQEILVLNFLSSVLLSNHPVPVDTPYAVFKFTCTILCPDLYLQGMLYISPASVTEP